MEDYSARLDARDARDAAYEQMDMCGDNNGTGDGVENECESVIPF